MSNVPPEIVDHLGRSVHVGTRVKVLGIPNDFLEALPHTDRALVREMIGAVFEVEEIDTYGQAWVSKWWDRGPGNSIRHSVGLASFEIAIVPNAV